MKLSVRSGAGDTKPVTVADDASIVALKEAVATAFDLPADEIRLMYQGRVLKDDQTVKDYDMKEDSQVYLVRRRTTSGSAPAQGSLFSPQPASSQGAVGQQAASGGGPMPDTGLAPEQMMALLNSPFMQQLLQDPRLLQEAMSAPEVANNPQAQALLRMLMQNPAQVQQLASMAGQEMGGDPVPRPIFDLGLRVMNGEPVPPGLPQIQFRGTPPNFGPGGPSRQAPASSGQQAQRQQSSSAGAGGSSRPSPLRREFLSREQIRAGLDFALGRSSSTPSTGAAGQSQPSTSAQSGSSTQPGASAQQQQQQQASTAEQQGAGSMDVDAPASSQAEEAGSTPASAQQPPSSGGGGGGGSGGDARQRYAAQLQQLADMGFTDEAQCLQALEAANGDVNGALSFLV